MEDEKRGRFRPLKNKKGFTFVECIVAIALFAIIGTLGFSMFSNSTRYMSKAKKEEQKLVQSQTMVQKETFKNADGNYILYGASSLKVEKMLKKEIAEGSIPTDKDYVYSYYIIMNYVTDYGNVDVAIPIKTATSKNGQTGDINRQIKKFWRYSVISDVGTPRYVYIYLTDNYKSGDAYDTVPINEVYVD